MSKKSPQLRFEGFTDDWEERKLSSGLREYTDRVIVEDDKEYYQISVRNNFGGITLRGSKMGNKIGRKRQAKINLTKYPQTLIFTRQTVEQGGIGWVDKYCDGAIVTENMPTISLDTSVFSNYFLTNLFQTRIFYKNAILDNIEGGSAQIAIHESKFLSSTLLFPNLYEQEKIGQFFKQLDDTIDLHQRKLDLLKEQKKGYLQKMFPKNGAKVPELRFAGFADDWEERKLGNLSQDTIGGGTPKTSVTEYWNGEIPWIQSSDLANDKLYGVLPKKFITEDAVKNSATKLIPANSIAIVTRVGVGKLAFMPYEFASSQDFLSLSNLQVDCNFGMYSIYKMLQRELNNIQGTSIKGITKADLLDKETFVPIKVEEQQKIGSFFKQLDDIIDLHQRRLDLLKEQKKGFLQKMFI